jgi:flagellar biosynthesis/type III secretory pathway protein FliH
VSTATVIKADAVQMVFLDRRVADEERRSADREREARHTIEVDAAYQSGVADGRRAAEADGLGAMPKVAAAIDRAVTGLAEATARRADDDTATLVAYAAEIARWILGRELSTDAAAVLGRIEGALDGLNPNGRLVIRVAPAAVDLVRRWAEGRDADVVGDATLTAGEARLEAGDAGADLTWAHAFGRLQKAFEA